ncbi:ABC transporter substrate-binding protein [Caldimonas tepidiphila]|uniref:ABC transporter substrate-binding protein n=1 Tax=Caldimonas tepidiphila TaxID=2315841 RepID=UPI000E5B8BC7|nr:ABC transporter substrate-binding protein [Caldimonas tepidiphila]
MKIALPRRRLLALAACASLLAAAPARAATPPDQLVIGFSMNNLLSLDPANATGLDVAEIAANIYDALVVLDPQNPQQVQPGLAERWQIAPDGRSLRFTLRQGAKFHSGQPVTAEDAAWSLQRVLKLNLALATTWKSYGYTRDNVEKLIRAEDPQTLVIEFAEPTDPRMVLYTLATSVSAVVLDRKTVLANEKAGDLGAAWLINHAAGSGPFKLDEWRAKEVLLASRFDEHWRGPAKMRRIVWRHMTESQSMRLMLDRGDLDVATGMAPPDIEALKSNPKVQVQAVQRGTLYYVAASTKDPRFADRRVRLALRHLIDYEGLNRTVMPHYGVLHQRPVPIGLAATLPGPGYRLDVAQARKLLAEAGYPQGFKTTIRAVGEPPFTHIATNLQATLAQAGIEASIVTGTGNLVYGAMRDRKFEIIVGRGGGGMEPHPHSSLRSLAYNPDNSDAAKLTNFQGWRTGFQSTALNELIDGALLEKNEARQLKMYQDAQRLYEQEVAAIQPISQMVETVLLRSDVKGYVGHPSATTRLHGVSKQR